MNWNTALRSLLLIRFGQELGTDSATARAVAFLGKVSWSSPGLVLQARWRCASG